MSTTIHMFFKSNLEHQDQIDIGDLGMSNVSSFTICHTAYTNQKHDEIMPYSIEITSNFTPDTPKTDFAVSVRKNINLTKNDAKQVQHPHPDKLPPGFVVVKNS